ncbi:hypothetical protein D3C87_1434690 [compost metagenome]
MAEFVHENALHQADVDRDDTLGVAAKTGVRTRALQAGIIAALRRCRLRRRSGRCRVLRTGARAATTRRQPGPRRQSGRRRICRGLRGALIGGDGEVRNAERANVIRHDADVTAQRGHIGNVADLLAIHDEARGARHFNHFDAVRTVQLGHVGHRAEIAAVLAFQTEELRILVRRNLKQAQAFARAVVQHNADGSLGVL